MHINTIFNSLERKCAMKVTSTGLNSLMSFTMSAATDPDQSSAPTVSPTLAAENKVSGVSSSRSLTDHQSDLDESLSKYGFKQSRYIAGLMTGYEVANDFHTKMQGILEYHKSLAQEANSYAELYLVGRKAEKATEQYVKGYATEQETKRMEEDLKKAEEEAEEKSQENVENKEPTDTTELTDTPSENVPQAQEGETAQNATSPAASQGQTSNVTSSAEVESNETQNTSREDQGTASAPVQAAHIDLTV